MTRSALLHRATSCGIAISTSSLHNIVGVVSIQKEQGALCLQLSGGKGLYKSEIRIYDYSDDATANVATKVFADFMCGDIPYETFKEYAHQYAQN